MSYNRRIQKELKDMIDNPPENISAGLNNDNDLSKIKATIQGPVNTPFEGGIFKLLITFPKTYPFSAPKIIFKTQMFHPNISSDGDICLDILKNNWSPVLTIKHILLSICSLLDDPNVNDPLNSTAARTYRNSISDYNKEVRKYTLKYASS